MPLHLQTVREKGISDYTATSGQGQHNQPPDERGIHGEYRRCVRWTTPQTCLTSRLQGDFHFRGQFSSGTGSSVWVPSNALRRIAPFAVQRSQIGVKKAHQSLPIPHTPSQVRHHFMCLPVVQCRCAAFHEGREGQPHILPQGCICDRREFAQWVRNEHVCRKRWTRRRPHVTTD